MKAYFYDDYMVVSGDKLPKFVKDVKQFLASGWICVGGVTIERRSTDRIAHYYQAMARKTRT